MHSFVIFSFKCFQQNLFNISITDPLKYAEASRNLLQKSAEVNAFNLRYDQGLENYKQQVYDFNIMTPADVLKSRTGSLASDAQNSTISRRKRSLPQGFAASTQCTSAPTFKNWVTEGKVTPVQNQGECNSCYVFASVAALESATAITYNRAPVKLSEQQLVECIRQYPYGGCNLGRVEWVWDSIKSASGAVAESSHTAYNAKDTGTCLNGLPKSPNTLIDHYVVIPYADEATLKCSLAANGPHAISVDFTSNMMNYKSGIFDDSTNDCNSARDATGKMLKPYNHAVTLVGYGSEPNNAGVMTDYWLIKNSWGSTWGLGGYIKLARNKNNLCHIATDARYPVMVITTSNTF